MPRNQTGFCKNSQVPTDSGLTHPENLTEFADRKLSDVQDIKNPEAGGLSKRAQGLDEVAQLRGIHI